MKIRSNLMVLGALVLATGSVFGQSLEDRLRDQLRQTTEQLRQVQDGQSALQARAAAAEAERDTLKKDVANLKAQLARTSSNSSGPASQALGDQIAKDKAALAQAASSMQEAQADHGRLQATVTKQATMLQVCEQKNAQLVKISNDILDKFSNVGWWDALNLSEPFIRDSHLKLEQMAQDYGDQIYDGKFDPRGVKMPSTAATKATDTVPAATPAH